MTTETIEQTPAEQRKVKADQHVQTLTAERERLQNRKKTAAEDATRLCDDIAKAERTGADPTSLTALRRDRTETEQVGGDLDRVISNIETELVHARAELRAAVVSCEADRYNALVAKQRSLNEVLIEAIMTVTETIRVKEGLAQQQDKILGGVRPYPELSPAGVRHAFLQEITKRLESEEGPKNAYSLQSCDWSCREMTDQGDLLPVK